MILNMIKTVHSHPNQEFSLTKLNSKMVSLKLSTHKAKISLRFPPKETSNTKAVAFKTNLETTTMNLLHLGYSGTTTTVLMTGLREATHHTLASMTLTLTLSSISATRSILHFLALNR